MWSVRGSCFGMTKMQSVAMGMHTSATNQNTHDHDANCTNIAPMIRPSTIASSCQHILAHKEGMKVLTVPDSAAPAEDAYGACLLRRFRKDVNEKCQGGRDGHGRGNAAQGPQNNQWDLARYEAGTDR